MIWLEGLKMALGAIGAHKLRSALTLVGIIAGVAAIMAVMTGVSVIQSQMEAELSVLGSRVFQAQKYPPFGFEDHNNRNLNETDRSMEARRANFQVAHWLHRARLGGHTPARYGPRTVVIRPPPSSSRWKHA